MTSDADSRVRPDWVDANLDELATADLICGAVEADPHESAAMLAAARRRGAREARYMRLTLDIVARLDPRPHNPAPRHASASGASLAFRPAVYADIGGMPPLRVREDRVLAERAEAREWRVRHSVLPVVVTSVRLIGRTEGGMAGTLRAQLHEPDPLCDELLEPARATVLRAGLRGRLRRAWGSEPEIAGVLDAFSIPRTAVPEGRSRFGVWWGALEASLPRLARRRLRRSDLARELPLLEVHAGTCRAGAAIGLGLSPPPDVSSKGGAALCSA